MTRFKKEAVKQFLRRHGKEKALFLPFGCNGFEVSYTWKFRAMRPLIIERAVKWKAKIDSGEYYS